jgi:hypothetical protein
MYEVYDERSTCIKGVSCTSSLKMEAEHSSEMHISTEVHYHVPATALRTANPNQ